LASDPLASVRPRDKRARKAKRGQITFKPVAA
jgi:hypothetical protein